MPLISLEDKTAKKEVKFLVLTSLMEVLFTESEINDRRISKILHCWDNDKFIDPPIIGVCNINSNKVSFSDGRHRAKVAYFLKYFQIFVLIYKPDIDCISKILKLTLP